MQKKDRQTHRHTDTMKTLLLQVTLHIINISFMITYHIHLQVSSCQT